LGRANPPRGRGAARASLSEYFDELLSPDEQLEKSSARLAAYFDGLIEGDEVTEQ
jgi:hypothetical protein